MSNPHLENPLHKPLRFEQVVELLRGELAPFAGIHRAPLELVGKSWLRMLVRYGRALLAIDIHVTMMSRPSRIDVLKTNEFMRLETRVMELTGP